MAKYIWATDLAQFNVNDEALEKFEKFDTSDEAFQDAIEHFCGMGCDVTIYVAELELHLANIQMKEYRESPTLPTPKYKVYTAYLANKK